MKHSRMGIASFVIGITAWLLYVPLVLFAQDLVVAGFYLLDLLVPLVLGGFVLGLGLGIGGLIQRDRKKAFAIVGILFPLAFLAFFALFMIFLSMLGPVAPFD